MFLLSLSTKTDEGDLLKEILAGLYTLIVIKLGCNTITMSNMKVNKFYRCGICCLPQLMFSYNIDTHKKKRL